MAQVKPMVPHKACANCRQQHQVCSGTINTAGRVLLVIGSKLALPPPNPPIDSCINCCSDKVIKQLSQPPWLLADLAIEYILKHSTSTNKLTRRNSLCSDKPYQLGTNHPVDGRKRPLEPLSSNSQPQSSHPPVKAVLCPRTWHALKRHLNSSLPPR